MGLQGLVPTPREKSLQKNDSPVSGRPTSGIGARTTGTCRPLFQLVWEQLHADPQRLPYSWHQQDGHWCCRLRSLTREQRKHIECERVADCPEIELRILAQPRTQPLLAEVVFPPSMSIAQAK